MFMTSVVFFVRMRALKTRDARTLTRRGFTEMAMSRGDLTLSIEPAPNCLSLAYRGLTDIPREVVTGLASVEILDLSHNKISDLRCLNGLERLTTLNLDSNKLDSHARFPPLPNLRVLWVNCNEISNLSVFVENLSLSCPRLFHLSMMNNPAAPSYFNGGSRQEYNDYRHYIISYYPQLGYLDDCSVGVEEREEAEKIYGRRRAKSKATSPPAQPHGKRKTVSR